MLNLRHEKQKYGTIYIPLDTIFHLPDEQGSKGLQTTHMSIFRRLIRSIAGHADHEEEWRKHYPRCLLKSSSSKYNVLQVRRSHRAFVCVTESVWTISGIFPPNQGKAVEASGEGTRTRWGLHSLCYLLTFCFENFYPILCVAGEEQFKYFNPQQQGESRPRFQNRKFRVFSQNTRDTKPMNAHRNQSLCQNAACLV